MSSNVQPPIVIQSTTPPDQQAAFINQNFQALSNALNPLIISNGTANTVILGKQTDGSYALQFFDNNSKKTATFDGTKLEFFDSSGVGTSIFSGGSFKVAKSGVEVTTATADQLIFNSSQDVLKVVNTGTASHAIPSPLNQNTTSTLTVAHNLGYVPVILSYLTSASSFALPAGSYFPMPYFYPNKTGATWEPGVYVLARVDATNIYFDVSNYTSVNLSSLGTFSYKYYLLQETAS